MSKTGKWLAFVVAVIVLGLIAFAQLTAVPTVSWTMPGDPKPGRKAARVAGHELVYSTDSAQIANSPATAQHWTPMPAVADSGVKMTVTLAGLSEDVKYWFRYRVVDSAGNFSGWSNQPFKIGSDNTPPQTVTDLR